MTAATPLVPAVGGTRRVPTPDSIATDYILLGLRLDQHMPGLVDGYYGPADLKARVDLEQRRSPTSLRDAAAALAERVDREVDEPDRRDWLAAQLVALETQAGALAGDPLPYTELVERCMGFAPRRTDDGIFKEAAASLDTLLPGRGSLDDRLEAWDRSLEVPIDRLQDVGEWLVACFREAAARIFGLPDGERLRISLVRDQPWSAYNWYDGGRHSRVDINVDLPVRAPDLIHTAAHETYPGHHVEHAWKEADLVDGRSRLESSILLINTPECPVSEGLADIGVMFASPPADRAELLVELLERAGTAPDGDPAAARDLAERAVQIAARRETLSTIRGNAALRRHADGASHDEVLDYLREVGHQSSVVAAKRLEFIGHPLWRTNAFVYAQGAALLERWIASSTNRSRRVGSSRSWVEGDLRRRSRAPGQPRHGEAGHRAGEDGEADHRQQGQAAVAVLELRDAGRQPVAVRAERVGLRRHRRQLVPEVTDLHAELLDLTAELRRELVPNLGLRTIDRAQCRGWIERGQAAVGCSDGKRDRHVFALEVLKGDLPGPVPGVRQGRGGCEVAVRVVVLGHHVDGLARPYIDEMDGRGLPRGRGDAVLHDLEADLDRLVLHRGFAGLGIGHDLCPPTGHDRHGQDQQHGHSSDRGGDPTDHRSTPSSAGLGSGSTLAPVLHRPIAAGSRDFFRDLA